jgi:hypothetical protein
MAENGIAPRRAVYLRWNPGATHDAPASKQSTTIDIAKTNAKYCTTRT